MSNIYALVVLLIAKLFIAIKPFLNELDHLMWFNTYERDYDDGVIIIIYLQCLCKQGWARTRQCAANHLAVSGTQTHHGHECWDTSRSLR